MKIDIIDQTETTITFKIPTGIKPGRWALMIHLSLEFVLQVRVR